MLATALILLPIVAALVVAALPLPRDMVAGLAFFAALMEVGLWIAAAARFDFADMKLYLAVTRRRIGALQDDAAGRALKGEADEWMAAQDIKNPAAMTRTLAPGFPDPS